MSVNLRWLLLTMSLFPSEQKWFFGTLQSLRIGIPNLVGAHHEKNPNKFGSLMCPSCKLPETRKCKKVVSVQKVGGLVKSGPHAAKKQLFGKTPKPAPAVSCRMKNAAGALGAHQGFLRQAQDGLPDPCSAQRNCRWKRVWQPKVTYNPL